MIKIGKLISLQRNARSGKIYQQEVKHFSFVPDPDILDQKIPAGIISFKFSG
jgi:hypothetical protein